MRDTCHTGRAKTADLWNRALWATGPSGARPCGIVCAHWNEAVADFVQRGVKSVRCWRDLIKSLINDLI